MSHKYNKSLLMFFIDLCKYRIVVMFKLHSSFVACISVLSGFVSLWIKICSMLRNRPHENTSLHFNFNLIMHTWGLILRHDPSFKMTQASCLEISQTVQKCFLFQLLVFLYSLSLHKNNWFHFVLNSIHDSLHELSCKLEKSRIFQCLSM